MDSASMKAITSSDRHDWPTPREFFDAVERMFIDRFGGPFELDAAASAENHKAPLYYTEETNGLAQAWRGRVWLNPPYGAQIGDWVRHAYQESQRHGATVAVLVPARVDTKWFHSWATKAAEIRFIRGRIQFEGAAASAPFPSVLLIFYKHEGPRRVHFWEPYRQELALFEDARTETFAEGLNSTIG